MKNVSLANSFFYGGSLADRIVPVFRRHWCAFRLDISCTHSRYKLHRQVAKTRNEFIIHSNDQINKVESGNSKSNLNNLFLSNCQTNTNKLSFRVECETNFTWMTVLFESFVNVFPSASSCCFAFNHDFFVDFPAEAFLFTNSLHSMEHGSSKKTTARYTN